jgi:hypothetical protein
MKIKHGILLVTAFIVLLSFISCSTVGQYLPLSSNENVIGTIQTSFIARDSWITKNESMNSQAYIKLLEAAVQKYPGKIDIRDIVWVTGRKIGQLDTEVSAMAKVIRVDSDETKN